MGLMEKNGLNSGILAFLWKDYYHSVSESKYLLFCFGTNNDEPIWRKNEEINPHDFYNY